MRDISLHILDIAENSIRAGASLISITVAIDSAKDELSVRIEDNGCGMGSKMLSSIKSPFATSRTTRSVGLGIPLLTAGCEMTGGGLNISSSPGKGTSLAATYKYSHIDRPPMGDIAETIYTLSLLNPHIDFVFCASKDETFLYDTRSIKKTLDGLPITHPDASKFLRLFLQENTAQVLGGSET